MWFYRLYQLCNITVLVGYVLVLFDWLVSPILVNDIGVEIIQPGYIGSIGLLLVFYGLYFGVMVRDCAEICADKMASIIGVILLLMS